MLWFAFVLWIYDIWHNRTLLVAFDLCVVICFRSLNLWYLAQPNFLKLPWSQRCDLLSFFEFMIFGTTFRVNGFGMDMLWFAFVLWIYDIWHNLIYQSNWLPALWFAFVLWIYDIWHNFYVLFYIFVDVVICFRSLNLWYLAQHMVAKATSESSCDLLSFFEFMIFGTTGLFGGSLRFCCDLLSFFEFMIFGTTHIFRIQCHESLWFAFVLWIYDIWHNFIHAPCIYKIVVICFRSLNLWYLAQPYDLYQV